MSTPNIDFQERFRQNNGILIGDFAHHSNQNFGNQQNWNMAPPLQVPVMEAGSQQRNISPDRSSSSIMSRFESPASAFYATEKYMGFPQYDCQVSVPSLCSQYTQSCDSHIPLHPYPGGNHSINSGSEQDGHSFGVRTTAQTIIKPHFCGNHCYKGLKISSSQQQNKFVPFQGNQENRVGCNPCSSPFAELGFCSRQEKQSPRFSSSNALPTSLSSKTRIRWTQDLHEKFVGCVNRLGGAEKATPKAILKLMDSDGLTIFHVKSHLQKYRLAKYMPDSSEGKAEKRTGINDVSQLDVKTAFQIREALQLQLDVQRRLHEQLESQRNLQLSIQEQGNQLKMMFDQQQKTTNNLLNNQNLDITSPDEPTFSLEDIDVSIAEGSDSNTHFPSKIS